MSYVKGRLAAHMQQLSALPDVAHLVSAKQSCSKQFGYEASIDILQPCPRLTLVAVRSFH